MDLGFVIDMENINDDNGLFYRFTAILIYLYT